MFLTMATLQGRVQVTFPSCCKSPQYSDFSLVLVTIVLRPTFQSVTALKMNRFQLWARNSGTHCISKKSEMSSVLPNFGGQKWFLKKRLPWLISMDSILGCNCDESDYDLISSWESESNPLLTAPPQRLRICLQCLAGSKVIQLFPLRSY